MPRISVHAQRHTFSTQAKDAGLPLIDIAAVLGHSNIDTTAGYTHASPESLRKVTEVVGSRIFGAS